MRVAYETERLEILKMVQSKQISPEDGARLIKALFDERSNTPPTPPRPTTSQPDGRWFKVVVEEPGVERVNVSVPLGAMPMVLRFVERFVPGESRESFRAAQEAIATGFRGDLIRVEKPGGQNVRVWIE
jgi:hypothetical protein